MQTIEANEAKLSELINTTNHGEIVLITQAGKPTAIISPVSINQSAVELAKISNKPKRQRRLGTATGLFTMSDDFDEPLDFK
jgi:prevent-host-death family protein